MNKCYWIIQTSLVIICIISFILGFIYFKFDLKNEEKTLFKYDFVVFFAISILCILLYCGFIFYQLNKVLQMFNKD
jgi:FtsH-binding integral membrane protein